MVANLPQPLSLARSYDCHQSSLHPTIDMSGLSLSRYRMAVLSAGLWASYGLITGQHACWASASLAVAAHLAVLSYHRLIKRRQPVTVAQNLPEHVSKDVRPAVALAA